MSYSFNAKGILASRLLWLDHLDNALLFVYQSKQQLLRRISFKSRVVSCGVIYSFLEVEKHKNSYMILRYTTTKSLRLTVKKNMFRICDATLFRFSRAIVFFKSADGILGENIFWR